MSRSPLVPLLVRVLIATPVSCVAFAALSAPSEVATVVQAPEAGCAGKASAPAAGAQPDAQAVACEPQAQTTEQDDRSYLLETASPGDTMMRQGPELAIARLNPQFAARLAGAIRDARQSGLPSAGIFSAYRPPGFGVGGFGDKFKSLHAYGLAVDMTGVGDPGSPDAKLWHEIAARHGIICPYGTDNRTEWNHCQATELEKVVPEHPLRKTITADGPVEREAMFTAGSAIIDELPKAISVAQADNTRQWSVFGEAAREPSEHVAVASLHHGRKRLSEALARGRQTVKARTVTVAKTVKAKTITVARNEERVTEKSHGRRIDEAKVHGVRKGAARSAEGRREPARRRSHVA